MSPSFLRSRARFAGARVESLENRQLLSVAVPTAAVSPVIPVSVSRPPVLIGGTVVASTLIHAETTQAFRAVLGTIYDLKALPTGYSLNGVINWGDGTPTSAAQFVPLSNGSLDVLGAHTYSAVGTDAITIAVTAVPPAGSLAAIIVVGTIHSTASVIAPNGGDTLEETAGVAFTANVGTFQSTLSSSTMTAVITWGDGTQSVGKIVALPNAGPVPGFAVYGSHTYAQTGSYAVHITVYSAKPTPILSPTPITTPPTILVAQIDSVIDVLPPLPTAV